MAGLVDKVVDDLDVATWKPQGVHRSPSGRRGRAWALEQPVGWHVGFGPRLASCSDIALECFIDDLGLAGLSLSRGLSQRVLSADVKAEANVSGDAASRIWSLPLCGCAEALPVAGPG